MTQVMMPVYEYSNDSNLWAQVGSTMETGQRKDEFGQAMAFSGGALAFSTKDYVPHVDFTSFNRNMSIHVYHWVKGTA